MGVLLYCSFLICCFSVNDAGGSNMLPKLNRCAGIGSVLEPGRDGCGGFTTEGGGIKLCAPNKNALFC